MFVSRFLCCVSGQLQEKLLTLLGFLEFLLFWGFSFTQAVYNLMSRLVWRCDLQATAAAYVQARQAILTLTEKKTYYIHI